MQTKSIFADLAFFPPLPLSNKIRRRRQRGFHSTGLYLKASMRILQEHAQWMGISCAVTWLLGGVVFRPLCAPQLPPYCIGTIPSKSRRASRWETPNLNHLPKKPPPNCCISTKKRHRITDGVFAISLSSKTSCCFRTPREGKKKTPTTKVIVGTGERERKKSRSCPSPGG